MVIINVLKIIKRIYVINLICEKGMAIINKRQVENCFIEKPSLSRYTTQDKCNNDSCLSNKSNVDQKIDCNILPSDLMSGYSYNSDIKRHMSHFIDFSE